MYKRPLVILSILIIVSALLSSAASSVDISDPKYTNDLISSVDTPNIEPGEKGSITIILKNPYPEETVLENITFTVEIYNCIYMNKQKNISEVSHPPSLGDSGIDMSRDIERLESGETRKMKYDVHSFEETEEGVYSLRFKIIFWHEGKKELMKSKGYFSTSELKRTMDSGGENSSSEGGIGTSMLNVSGILPESSFTVREEIPRWPQYVLGFVTVLTGVLAVMFYMQEQYGSFPWLEDTF